MVVVVAAADRVAAEVVVTAELTTDTQLRPAGDDPAGDPAPEVTSFGALGLSQAVTDVLAKQDIVVPTPIQVMAIPDALAGKDVCGRAETGSGKTLAFGLPLLVSITRGQPKRPQALILVPTRELCAQVTEALEPVSAVQGLSLVAVYGGVSMSGQTGQLDRRVDVVIATPGRLLDLVRRRSIDLRDVTRVVIDEADQMADMGFLPQVHDVLASVPRGHQTMLFSATLDGQVATLVRMYMKDPVTHEVEKLGDIVDTQEHRFLAVHYRDKAKVAAAIINGATRSLVFVRTKRAADRVAAELRDEGISVAKTHGDLQQSVREKSLDRFAVGKVQALVATNVAARGLHVDDIDVVIHYDPPDDYKTFLHRSGRTARAGEDGLVVTLVEWDQVPEVERLQRSAGLHTEIVKMYSNDPRLADLASFEPDPVEFKQKTAAELSRRAGGRQRGRSRRRR